MPLKHKIRHSAKPVSRRGGLIQGKRPHRLQNAHKVNRKWPYLRAVLLWSTCAAILLIALAIIGYGIYLKKSKTIIIGICVVAVWMLFKIFYHLACKATTCPLCRASHLIVGKSSKHKKAYKIIPFSYSTTAIFTAVLTLCVRCMHCGVTFDINKQHRK